MQVAKENRISIRGTISELSQKRNKQLDDVMESNSLNTIKSKFKN